MDLEIINKLYLELSQVATAKTARELELESALRGLYEDTADYIQVNDLGNVHHNQSMKDARAALNMPLTYGTRHGIDCEKVIHRKAGGGYFHADDDDTPYNVDGAKYCGRCHHCL